MEEIREARKKLSQRAHMVGGALEDRWRLRVVAKEKSEQSVLSQLRIDLLRCAAVSGSADPSAASDGG